MDMIRGITKEGKGTGAKGKGGKRVIREAEKLFSFHIFPLLERFDHQQN